MLHIIQPQEILFGSNRNNLSWTPFSDQVVGGFSKIALTTHEEHQEFSGSLKPILDNGWAGMRSVKELHDLSKYKFIEIKIKTDGRPYHLQLEHDPAWQADKLSAVIDIVANKWKVMHLEMESLKIYNAYKGYSRRTPKITKAISLVQRYNILAASKTVTTFNFQIEYIKFH